MGLTQWLQWSFTEVGARSMNSVGDPLDKEEITNGLSGDPRSSSNLRERSVDVSWLVDATAPLSFTVKT